MTGAELQDLIFKNRQEKDGDVSLGLIPSIKQLDWLLFIDPNKDYLNYTPEQAENDMLLYFQYQDKRRKITYEYR